jgi:vacuolar-type H+-ATPase subunit I/STV1
MANTSEYGTKTLSVRIPTKDYVKIIEIAESKKLSTSEYIHLKLFKDDSDIITPLKNEIEALKASNEATKKKYSDLLVKWEDLVKQWNERIAKEKAAMAKKP